ncbi:hypothetical protein Patl1_21321 [Pistacia atlantica]|uniref:Uncharacterized protein n=1 Tax=Pistacia atlantica TaxID=434234 RepID=A0ACC1BN36_9ROSI|nr:hypothetical protein Patl1_21321 [Pistacia atlantica]
MDEQLFDAICNRLKPVLHTDESYIVREGFTRFHGGLGRPPTYKQLGVAILKRSWKNVCGQKNTGCKMNWPSQAEMLERVPAMLLQKPDEPDVSDEEPHS